MIQKVGAPLINAYWHRYLPRPLRDRLEGRLGLQAVLANSTWIVADKLVRMAVSLVVGLWTIRYLGPTQIGLLNYAAAFVGLFAVLANAGLDSLIVRDLVKNPSRQPELLGTSLVLRLLFALVSLTLTIFAINLVRPSDTQSHYLVILFSFSFFFQSFSVIDFYFQAKVQAKYSLIAAFTAFAITTFIKVSLLISGATLIAFAWATFTETVLSSLFLLIGYRVAKQSIFRWFWSPLLAIELVKQSWPLILSNLAIVVYMRIDQVMIGQMLNDREVGMFSAAVKITELWYFVPVALASSMFPTIIASKQASESLYYSRLQRLFSLLLWLGITVSIAVTIVRIPLVHLLLGQEYAESAVVLAIHAWAGVFVALGMASSGWYIVEGLQKLTFYRTLAGAIANILLNLVLIPRFGINGAAVATIVSYAISAWLSDAFNKKTRTIFIMKLRAFNPFFIFFPNGRITKNAT